MVRFFNFRGYADFDPLDFVAPARRAVLAIVVTAVVSTILVLLIAHVFHVVEFIGFWFECFEVAGFALIAAPLVLWLRRSSSVVIYLILLLPLVLTDLYLQAGWRDQGLRTLWGYPEGTLISLIAILPLRFFITTSVDALLIGPVCLWLMRLLAIRIYDREAASGAPTREQREALFPDEWTQEEVERPRRDAGFWVLRLLGIGYLSYLLLLGIGALGSSPWPAQIRYLMDMTYRNPLLALCTFSKITFMILLAFIGAYNERIRWYAALVLALGHAVSTGASLFFYFTDTPGTDYRDFLLTSAVVDGVMIALFIWIMIASAGRRERFAEERDFPSLFSVPATVARWLFAGLAALAAAVAACVLTMRLAGGGEGAFAALFAGPDPTIGNTLTMQGVLLTLALMLMKRERLRDYFQCVITGGMFMTVVPGIVWLIVAPVGLKSASGETVAVLPYFAGELILSAAILSALVALRRMYYNVEYTITSFTPSGARDIMALHDALFGDEDQRSDVLQSIDRYAGSIRGRKRGLLNFPFVSIELLLPAAFFLHPPFSVQSVEERRRFLRKYVIRTLNDRAGSFVPPVADLAWTMGVAAHSLLLFASYTNLRKQYAIGYVPPGARDRLQTDASLKPPPFANIAPLPVDEKDRANFERTHVVLRGRKVAPRVATPVNEHPVPGEVDYLVVGSGPGGAVMTYRLACASERSRILLVERGNRYSPLQDFNDRELEMMPKLYKEGGLQQSKRADMLVLQGECVGGGSVMYNAVCYEIPVAVKREWKEKHGIPVDALAAEYARTAKELHITPLPEASINRVVKERFIRGVAALNRQLPRDERLEVVPAASANQLDAMGDGLWNIGNRYMKKRSMLETYIPWAESAGKGDSSAGEPPGVRVISNTTAVRFRREGSRATSVVLRTATGDLRSVRVKKALVVAGGVIASSHFLLRSGIERNVGLRMSCNFALPVAFDFGERVAAFDGEQITMGAIDPRNRAIFETYFNPPGAFALSIPFFFGRHSGVMRDYARLLNFGALVGSESNGRVERAADLLNGQAFTWNLGDRDRSHIRYALGTLLEIGLAAGAQRAVVPTQPGIEIELSAREVARFRKAIESYPLATSDLLLATAHPQGGNVMAGPGAAPEMREERVVDERFRVVGLDNVFVADASVFPSSLTVNPQWTIMAMASLASKSVLELCA